VGQRLRCAALPGRGQAIEQETDGQGRAGQGGAVSAPKTLQCSPAVAMWLEEGQGLPVDLHTLEVKVVNWGCLRQLN
jgi:hypothetical protein